MLGMCEVLGAPSPEERVEQGGEKKEGGEEERRKEERKKKKERERRKDQSSEVENSSFQTLFISWERFYFRCGIGITLHPCMKHNFYTIGKHGVKLWFHLII